MWRFFDRCNAAAKEISTAIMDALFIRAGLLDEPTTEIGRRAYDKVRRQNESGNVSVSYGNEWGAHGDSNPGPAD